MSGHSKWAKIKRAKGANDAKKGMIFTKLAKAITLAASEGGGDPDMNFTLRLAVDKAKIANMPSDNIERAIKKGTGEGGAGTITRISYEAYGPAGSAVIVDCSTDNTNRTVAEVKRLMETGGGKMADAGSVSWQFTEKGLIIAKPAKLKKAEKYGAEDTYEPADKDEVMMELMEIEGIQDIVESEETDENEKSFTALEISVERNSFAQVDKKIREMGLEILSSELVKVANEMKEVSGEEKEKIEKFIENLEENDDVENVWPNVIL